MIGVPGQSLPRGAIIGEGQQAQGNESHGQEGDDQLGAQGVVGKTAGDEIAEPEGDEGADEE